MDQFPSVPHISPIMAVLTEIQGDTGKEPSFGSIHDFCLELHELFTSSGWLFYVFSLKGFTNERVTGFYYDGHQWSKASLPLPDIVYNRIHSRKSETSRTFADFIETAAGSNIAVFNRRFLHKWEVHKWLAARKNLQRFLPETCLYSEKSLLKMSTYHEDLFLKPINGSQGRDILCIQSKADRCYVSLSTSNGTEDLELPGSIELPAYLENTLKKQLYLLQQGIPLVKMDNRSIDFRILCHRSLQHKWRVTSSVARLSAQGHFAANLAAGGETCHPLQILCQFFEKEKAAAKLGMIKELALEAADCTAENCEGLVAELGIDVGIDNTGNPWIIEVNSKPSKNYHTGRNHFRPSAKAIAEYSFSLLKENATPGEGGFR
jgi:glutathione synthase/RimK-type ligase-like ATP-grasp enzyme